MIEVYSSHWGPCVSVIPTLKRIKLERDPDPKAFQYNPVRARHAPLCPLRRCARSTAWVAQRRWRWLCVCV